MSIRAGKILLAAAFLLESVQAAFNMRGQIENSKGFVTFLIVIFLLCALLLWSAFKRRDPLLPTSRGWKIFWNVVGVLCALSIVGNLLGLGKPRGQLLAVNGLRIPLDACMHGAGPMFKDNTERIAFCTCMATKLANDSAVSKAYKHELERGQLDMVVENLERTSSFDLTQLAECMASSQSIRWTETMLHRVKSDCLAAMKNDGADAEYDAERFCDCLTNKVAQHSPSFLLDASQDSTAALAKIREDCTALSQK